MDLFLNRFLPPGARRSVLVSDAADRESLQRKVANVEHWRSQYDDMDVRKTAALGCLYPCTEVGVKTDQQKETYSLSCSSSPAIPVVTPRVLITLH